MSATKLRVGIVGAGFGGAVHAPAFAAQGAFDVVAIASPNRAREVARARKIPHEFASCDEMLANVDLDVLAVASPPFRHHADVMAGLARGLHIFCEKPFALHVDEAREMLAASERAGTVCAIAHEFRYTSARFAMRELVGNGHLGALRGIELTLLTDYLRASSERPNSWWFERARGGGVTGALVSHLIDLATWLAGRPALRATGYERTANPQRHARGDAFASDVADGASVTIDYGEGLLATIVVDATRAVNAFTCGVHGEMRTVVTSGPSLLDGTTFVVDADETAELELAPQRHANLAAAHPNLPAFVTLLDAYADAIAGRPAEIPTFSQAVATQEILASIGYSA